jgi:pilus assembly protein Flp/PilA
VIPKMIELNVARLRTLAARFARNEQGATAIEYALIASLIAVACIGAFNLLGNSSTGSWSNMASKVTTAMQK